MERLAFLLGTILEKLHLPATALLLGLGRFWLSETSYLFVLSTVVLLQARKKECPLNGLVVKLKRKYQPSYPYDKERTFVWRFFQRFGLIAALYLFFFWFTISHLIFYLFS